MKELPKYLSVEESIKQEIINKQYSVGDKLPSEGSLMDEFKVSRHTIRAALSNLESQGVIYKEHGVGSFVKSLRPNKTVGVITTYLSEYIFPTIIRGIESVLSEAGYSMILASTDNNMSEERKVLNMLKDREVDALIIEPTKSAEYNTNIDLYLNLMNSNLPVIMINSYYDEVRFPTVRLDDFESGYKAVEYLVKNNHHDIGGIFKIDDKQGKLRLQGFIQACYDFGLNYMTDRVLVYNTENVHELKEKKFSDLLSDSMITGVVCYNDNIAMDLISYCYQNNIKIPSDLSIVSHDNSILSNITEIDLVSINHPKTELGRYAASEIVKAIENKEYNVQDKIYEAIISEGNSVKKIEDDSNIEKN